VGWAIDRPGKFRKAARMTRKSASRKAKPARRASKPARPLRAKKTIKKAAKRTAKKPNRKPGTIGSLVTAAGQSLALPIEASWHAGVAFNLQLLFKHAALIDEFSLSEDIEPAPVFRA
jgi:hypothetical protein